MDDDQKDVAIIEASALLVTLIFIILSIYSSNSALVTILEPFTYAVGFFFVVAASGHTHTSKICLPDGMTALVLS
jgi:hypothetical protein